MCNLERESRERKIRASIRKTHTLHTQAPPPNETILRYLYFIQVATMGFCHGLGLHQLTKDYVTYLLTY